MLHGLHGLLVSGHFAARVLPVAFASELDTDGGRRAHAHFIRLRHAWTHGLGPASSVRAVFDLAAAPFAHLLDFSVGDPAATRSGALVAPLRASGATVATFVVTPWAADLERRWSEAPREQARWCIAFNARAARLTDARRGYSRAFLEFDLDELADRPESFAVCWAIMRADAFVGLADAPLVERVLRASLETGETVCSALRHGVLDSVRVLLNALAAPRGRRARAPDPAAIGATFEQALTIVYRLLFLLFAEARQLVPDWHPVYRERYTMRGLTELARAPGPARGLWEAMQAISRLAHAGCEAGDLRVTPFNGRLFSPGATPLAERTDVDDAAARRALMSLATTPGRANGREEIAYRDLGVEQLGAVYETVLDYTPAVRANRDAPIGWEIDLARGGRARKDSSTFYTPRPLTDFLVRRTLAPLVRGLDPDAILALRVVDPAMGSGAFLVGACRYLAHAYEEALVESGGCLPGDLTDEDRARFRRVVAQRCLFGVDVNPRAVQLARLSLWLATLASDAPLTFVDHHLRVGDSLIGASPADIVRQPPGGGRARAAALPLVDLETFHTLAGRVVIERDRIALEPGDTIAAVRAKERALAALAAPAHELTRWKAVSDLWCACWFWPGGHDARIFADLAERLRGRASLLPPAAADARLATARAIAGELQCFHWPLEFPEVFFDAQGVSRGDSSGFDAVLGNPPWDMIRADRGAATDEDRRRVAQLTRFFRESGIYPANASGHANRYQLFVERALHLVRRGGRVGLVLPSGVATDQGSAALRRALLHTCDTDAIVGFDNRDEVFPIHRSTRFVLLTTTKGGATRTMPCAFGLRNPSELEAIADAGPLTGARAISLTPAALARISGDDLTIPEFRSPLDLAIVERIAARFPALGAAEGWHARFGRELNATDDRSHFVRGDESALPILEGKDIAPFTAHIRGDGPRLRAADTPRLVGRVPPSRLAYRDVASATNRLTLIAARLPARTVTTHTLFCLKSPATQMVQRYLCGILNSFVANYLIRLRVTTHVGVGPIERLPVPRPATGSLEFDRVVQLVARLEDRNGEDEGAYVELQARVASLYEISPPEWAHIVNTFPLIDERVRRACVTG